MSHPFGPWTRDDGRGEPGADRQVDGPDDETRVVAPIALPIIPSPRPGGARPTRPAMSPPRARPPSPRFTPPPMTPPRMPAVTPPAPAEGSRRRGWHRPGVRRPLIGLAVLAQAFVIAGAAAWWTAAHASPPATAAETPVSWDAVITDVGPAGVNLRTTPAVLPDSAHGTAGPAAHLRIVCGVTGDAVSNGASRSAIWLKTDDGRYISGLYVQVVGKTQIASCPQQDLPLIAIPAPPPGEGATVDPSTSVVATTSEDRPTEERQSSPSSDRDSDGDSGHDSSRESGHDSDTVGQGDRVAHSPQPDPVGTGMAPAHTATSPPTTTTSSGVLGQVTRRAYDNYRPVG